MEGLFVVISGWTVGPGGERGSVFHARTSGASRARRVYHRVAGWLDMKTGFYRARDKVVLGVAGVIAAIALAATIWSVHSVVPRWSRGRVDFSRDIRPIFNQNCVACHGGVR